MQEAVIPRVSVIVASHREHFVEGLVSSLHEAVWESVPTEIIIVADYPVDRVKTAYPHIQWLYVPDRSISVKRNVGINTAKGAICAFIDDDCRPSERWVVHAVTYLDEHPEMVGVEGLTEIAETAVKAGAYKEFKRLETRGYRTNNIFYRRDALIAISLFDERFSIQREDVDLAYSLLEAGHMIGYASDVTVTHQFRTNEKWDLLKNCINRRFDPLLFQKHRELYRRNIGTPYPPSILLIFLAHIVVFTSAMVLRNLIPLFAGIDFGITFSITLRRTGLPFVYNPVQWMREFVSFFISPFVLFGALVYGSFRYRYVFLI